MCSGDYAYDLHTNNGSYGDTFLNNLQPIASRVPYLGVQGNHEGKWNASHYRNRFTAYTDLGVTSKSGNNWSTTLHTQTHAPARSCTPLYLVADPLSFSTVIAARLCIGGSAGSTRVAVRWYTSWPSTRRCTTTTSSPA